MTDWAKFVLALGELLGWYGQSHVACCPECGNAAISAKAAERAMPMTASDHGISVPVKCGLGHDWTMRVSSWRVDYPEVRLRLAKRQKVWELADLQAEIKSKEAEAAALTEKYFDLRKKLQQKTG